MFFFFSRLLLSLSSFCLLSCFLWWKLNTYQRIALDRSSVPQSLNVLDNMPFLKCQVDTIYYTRLLSSLLIHRLQI